jgi:hypothetical protein
MDELLDLGPPGPNLSRWKGHEKAEISKKDEHDASVRPHATLHVSRTSTRPARLSRYGPQA